MQTRTIETSASFGQAAVYSHLRTLAGELAQADPGQIESVRAIARRLPLDSSIVSGVEVITANDCSVPATWLVPHDADARRRIVYCHGLSFIAGDLAVYGAFVSRLAKASRCCALFIDYRLAPENLFPAAHDDCVSAFVWAREHGPNGPSIGECAVLGDSCGASLTLATSLHAARAGTPAAGTVVFAPFIDLAVTGASSVRNDGRDPLLSSGLAKGCAPTYAPGIDARNLRLSPLYDDLSPLTRLQVHGSTSDPVLDDAQRLVDRACQAGVSIEYHLWSDVPHCWFLFHQELPEARLATDLAAEFVRRL